MGVLANRVVLITGAGKGIGEAIARRFAAEGARLVLTSRTEADVKKLAEEIGQGTIALKLDVSSRAEWAAAVARVREAHETLNILVNCAGVTLGGSIEDTTDEDWRTQMGINLDGVFYGCQTALPLMKAANKPGSIVNVGSAFAVRPLGSFLGYSTSKAAMTTMTKTIALHCATSGYNIRANVVHPGGTETPMLERTFEESGLSREEAYGLYSKIHPMGRYGKPEEVAAACLWLASDASSFTTGAEINVDGASSIRE